MSTARPMRPWSLLVVPAALALVLPACGGGSKKQVETPAPASTLAVTCGDAATLLGPLGAAQLGKDRPDADAVRVAVEEVVRAECAAGPWSPEVLACLGEARADTVDGCHKLLPEAQANAFDAALDARMKALLGDAPKPPPGGGAGDDAEGGSGAIGGSDGARSTSGGGTVERRTRGRKIIEKDTTDEGADPCDGGEADPCDGGEADPCDGGEADGGFFRR